MDFEQVSGVVDVPRNTGTEGFIQLIRSILKLGHVQDIHVTANGKVSYKYLAVKSADRPEFNPEQLFERASPSCVVRNSTLVEVRVDERKSSVETLVLVTRSAQLDGVVPNAWVTGANTLLFKWLPSRSNISAEQLQPGTILFGLPIYRDRMLPDESLILCASPCAGADLVDTTHAYKIAMVLPTTPKGVP